MHRVDLTAGAVLEKGCVYVVPLMERLALPAEHHRGGQCQKLDRAAGPADPHDHRWRGGIRPHSRRLPGPLYAEVCPRSFSVLVRPGMRLNQIRFRRGQAVLSDAELAALHARDPLVIGDAVISEGLGFSVDLRPAAGRSGRLPRQAAYRGDRPRPDRPLSRREFWEEVRTDEGRIILDPGAFYILVSREAVTIPPDYAAEMAPYLAMVGRIPRALRRLLRPRLRPCRGGRRGVARRAGGALPRGALRAGARAGRRAAGLRTDGRTARNALWRGHRLELSGPGAEAVQALPQPERLQPCRSRRAAAWSSPDARRWPAVPQRHTAAPA